MFQLELPDYLKYELCPPMQVYTLDTVLHAVCSFILINDVACSFISFILMAAGGLVHWAVPAQGGTLAKQFKTKCKHSLPSRMSRKMF